MDQSPFEKPIVTQLVKKYPSILVQKIYYRVHKRLPLVPILS